MSEIWHSSSAIWTPGFISCVEPVLGLWRLGTGHGRQTYSPLHRTSHATFFPSSLSGSVFPDHASRLCRLIEPPPTVGTSGYKTSQSSESSLGCQISWRSGTHCASNGWPRSTQSVRNGAGSRATKRDDASPGCPQMRNTSPCDPG